MCIAILNKRSHLSANTLKTSFDNNPEGAGLLWSHAGKIQTFKTYDRAAFVAKYNEIRPRVKTPIVIHCRIATSGHTPYINLHPFEINERLGFVHNGVIYGTGNEEHSDTYQLCELLKTLPANFLQNAGILQLLAGYIDTSKLIFLDGAGVYTIVNESAGSWNGDTWFSNESHKESRFYYFGNQKVEKTNAKIKSKPAASKPEKLSPAEREDIDTATNLDVLRSYFTGVNSANLAALADELGYSTGDAELIWEIEDTARYYATYDLRELVNKICPAQRYNESTYATFDFYN